MQDSPETLELQLRAFVEQCEGEYFPAPDKVTIEAVRKMTNIFGDRNPVYRDPKIARESGHATVVAPPQSVFAWWLSLFDEANASNWVDAQGIHRFRIEALPSRNRNMRVSTMENVCQVLANGGITSIAATGGEITLTRYPHVDEQLYYSPARVESVSDLKKTALGAGYFITYCTNVRDHSDKPVAQARITTYNFTPAAAMPDKPAGRPIAESVPGLSPFIPDGKPPAFADIYVGQELPSMIVEVTPSLIIAGAIFLHEELDIHLDRDLAQKRGFKDIFMNTSTTLGLVNRFISDWAGPKGVVESLKWRLGRQQYPNDDLCLTGKVIALERGESRGRVTVEVVGINQLGTHATCQVRLTLP